MRSLEEYRITFLDKALQLSADSFGIRTLDHLKVRIFLVRSSYKIIRILACNNYYIKTILRTRLACHLMKRRRKIAEFEHAAQYCDLPSSLCGPGETPECILHRLRCCIVRIVHDKILFRLYYFAPAFA